MVRGKNMVTMVGAFPVADSDLSLQRLLERLVPADRVELQKIGAATLGVLRSVLQVETAEQLRAVLAVAEKSSWPLRTATLNILQKLDGSDQGLVIEGLFAAYRDIRTRAEAKADLLGRDTVDRFLSVLESNEALLRRTLESTSERPLEQQRLYTIVAHVLSSLAAADVCLAAVLVFLLDEVPHYDPAAVALVVNAADELYTEVEDAFLAQRPVSGTTQATIAYETARVALGF